MDEEGKLKRNFERPIMKDNVAIPQQGYAIIRFIADNPGFWMLHCHLDSHSDPGMMMILKVGESGDLPPKPKDWQFYPIPRQHSNRINLNLNLYFLVFVVFIVKAFFSKYFI